MKNLIIMVILLMSINANAKADINTDAQNGLNLLDIAAHAAVRCEIMLSTYGYKKALKRKNSLTHACVTFAKAIKKVTAIANKYSHKELASAEGKNMTVMQSINLQQWKAAIRKLVIYMKLNKLGLDDLLKLEDKGAS